MILNLFTAYKAGLKFYFFLLVYIIYITKLLNENKVFKIPPYEHVRDFQSSIKTMFSHY